jgi:glucosylceramidase
MRIYVTSKYEKLYHKQIPVEQLTQPDFIILVDDTVKYQEIMGFGGAFTESACYTLNKMSKENQDKLLNAYYDKEKGLAYNLGRIHMNSCDFSLGNYTYVDQYDEELKSFNIEREFKYVIPTIKRAEAIYGD